MNRIGVVLSFATTLALAGAAHADRAKITVFPADDHGRSDAIQILDVKPQADASLSNIIFLNRCTGGCMITSSDSNSASAQESTIPTQPIGTVVQVAEFPWDQQTWDTMVQCVKEIYSPYNVVVTDVDPGPTVVHHECIVAGDPSNFGLPNGVGGISPVSADHSPLNNNISFVFADVWPPSEVLTMCAAVGQESGHSWGLDHEWSCTDPMGAGYHADCGGQRFFRNVDSQCGVNSGPDLDCNCSGGCTSGGPTQNSHERILGVFGAGTSIIPAPSISVVSPKDGATVTNGWTTFVGSSSKRGVYHVHLIVNGYEWLVKDVSDIPQGGVGSGANSAIYATNFQVDAPPNVPDGVMDLELKACDDIDVCSSAKLTVTKGSPCTDASQCAAGQKCDAGKCYWDPPTGMVGDPCTFPQACLSNLCIAAGANGDQICSQTCFQHIDGQCPMGFTCQLDASSQGYCFADQPPTGCCSTSDDGAGKLLGQAGAAFVVGVVAFRRRRRRA